MRSLADCTRLTSTHMFLGWRIACTWPLVGLRRPCAFSAYGVAAVVFHSAAQTCCSAVELFSSYVTAQEAVGGGGAHGSGAGLCDVRKVSGGGGGVVSVSLRWSTAKPRRSTAAKGPLFVTTVSWDVLGFQPFSSPKESPSVTLELLSL